MVTALTFGADFNNDNSEDDADSRSDAKGPEPEALAVGEHDGRTYALVGLERMGGIVVYDVTLPAAPRLLSYEPGFGQRTFDRDENALKAVVEAGGAGVPDLGPESIVFVPAADNPQGSGFPLVIVGNEVSGTVSFYELLTL